jgi:thiamine monophosphate kinase
MEDKKQSEFGYIESLIKKLPRTGGDVIVGVGDDAGVIKFGNRDIC